MDAMFWSAVGVWVAVLWTIGGLLLLGVLRDLALTFEPPFLRGAALGLLYACAGPPGWALFFCELGRAVVVLVRRCRRLAHPWRAGRRLGRGDG